MASNEPFDASVLPEVERIGTVTGILGGFAAGGLMMIGLKRLVVKFERERRRRRESGQPLTGRG